MGIKTSGRKKKREMGRGKIEIKRIENTSNRQVTYSKRRSGLIKKAKEITVLCEANVSLVIFNPSGKMHDYCSPQTTLVQMLEQYHKHSGKKLWDEKHENLNSEIERVKKENDNMQIKLRHLSGEDIGSLQIKELIAIEDALENGLDNVRHRKNEILNIKREKDQMLEEENKRLNYIYQQLHMTAASMDMNGREMGDEYHHHQQRVRDHFHSQMPLTFRIQPIQPNLHERM